MNTLGLVLAGVMLNFVVGLLAITLVAGRDRQHWLRCAPNFPSFVLVLEIWPVWVIADFFARKF